MHNDPTAALTWNINGKIHLIYVCAVSRGDGFKGRIREDVIKQNANHTYHHDFLES